MPSPIAGETSLDEREAAGLIGASRKKRKRKRDDSEGEMSPEEDSTASPPAGLIAGRDDGQQRLTSPPSGSKFVHEMARDDFGETCLEESTIIKNRSEDGSSNEEDDVNEDENGNATKEKSQPVDESSTSDVENFDGKIVYNPDGSAYIIEDSELSDEDAVELPQLMGNGCIVDGRGVNMSRNEGFPQISNAIYVSSRNQSLHHTLYGNLTNFTKGLQDKSVVPEVPVMHSYRVYSVRDNKYSERVGGHVVDKQEGENLSTSKDCSSVPVKPILMCFICKLSFGYAKSFVAHAMSDHNVLLRDDEKDILSHKNTSAIIQSVGKEKEPLVSFLEPLSPVVAPPLEKPQRPASGQSYSSYGENSTRCSSGSPNVLTGVAGNNGNNNSTSSNSNNSNRAASALNCVMDLTRKSPITGSSATSTTNNNGAVTSPGASPSPGLTVSPLMSSSMSFPQHPPNFLTGTTIGVCPDHMGGRPSGVDCSKCELILSSSRLSGVGGGPLAGMHSRNSCKTLKCPKCNWHYKYQETLEIHMKEKHPETETSCIYCIASQPHPRLARGETYTCGYKPYRCEVCNYSTTTKGNLSIHMQSDKHLNNMQELQNGTVSNSDLSTHQQQTPPAPQPHGKPTGMTSPSAGAAAGLPSYHSTISSSQAQKPKPTFRCDVCNYETNVARNLRIHMTSEKHTHNMMVLQQNMKQMQALSAIQPTQHQQQLNFEQLMHFHPGLTLPGEKPPPHSEAALADMAYNQALIIQLMTGGQLPPHMSPELSPNLDMGLNPETMEPPPEPADLNPENLFQCCVCNVFTSDSLEALSHHLAADRTKIREQEILAIVAGHYVCKLCTYKTTLKANFQLHCKTDKHLQRLQHVNHVKEGGIRNEWKLKYVSSPGGVQVRCSACDYYTNSTHKLQLHAAAQRHEFSAALFRHLRDNYDDSPKIYQCVLCEFSCTDKLPLFQHIRSMQHLKIEQIHQLHRRSAGKDGQIDFNEMFKVMPQPSDSVSEQSVDFCNQSQCSSAKPNNVQTPPSHRFSPSSSTASSSGSKDMDSKCTQSDSCKPDDEPEEPAESFETEGIRCSTCNKVFRNSEELCLHQNENGHFDIKQIEGSVFLCPKKECSAYFTTVLNVQRHYLDVHIQQNRMSTVAVSEKHVYKYRCSQCSLAFKTMEKLQIHSQYHFIRDATKCVLCGRSFRSIISLQKHVETMHADLSEEEMLIFKQSLLSNPLLLAGLSGQALDPSVTELLKKESMRMDAEESMDEDSPNKDTEEPLNMAGTENSDEDDETSKEQFIEDYMNSQAIAEKNYNDPNRKYKCHKCKMAFTRQSYLTLHNKKVPHRKGEKVIYPMEKYLDPNRPYKCEVCKESFTQKNILLVHYNSVSHLHKLKRASQDLQNNTALNTSGSGSNLMISPPSHFNSVSQLHKIKRDVPNAIGQGSSNLMISPPSAQMLTPKSNSSSEDDDKKSFKVMDATAATNANSLYCMFGSSMFPSLANTQTTNMPFTQSTDLKTPPPSLMAGDDTFMKLPQQAKKSSHMYKHLLESFGFDLVMQFNENHQRRQRKEREENERLLAELQSAQFMSEESQHMETRKDSVTDSVKDEKDDVPSTDELPEVSKSTCAHCNKEFSSVWVLKAHCEEVHKDLVPLDFLEKYAQQIKCEIDKKVVPVTIASNLSNSMTTDHNDSTMTSDANTTTCSKASGTSDIDSTIMTSASVNVPVTTTADVGTDTYGTRDDQDISDENSALNMSTNANTDTSITYDDNSEKDDDKDHMKLHPETMPNPPTACSTPASSTDSISPNGGSGNGPHSNNPSPNISMSLAQQMNEMQAALNAMAASQLQQQLQQFNPMMMGMAGLGMGLPLGLNMPALAAMNLQPPLVPMMMPPPSFDPLGGLGQAQNQLFSQQAAANMDTSAMLAKQQQHLMQQQQVANASQQKRARTRITDDQLKILRAHFDINNSPSEEQINKMAAESGLPPKVIKHWFRNTLFKERQRNKDSPYNFNNPPSTTLNLEEYEKTGETKVMPLNAGSGDEAIVQNNNVDSSVQKLNTANVAATTTARKTSTPSAPKAEQMSPHFQNHSPASPNVSERLSSVPTPPPPMVPKTEQMSPHFQHHSPPSPNISERLSSVPTPCSSPENLTVSSVFNSQHLSSEITATSSSMLNSSMHSGSNMLPPKLNQNFSTSTPSLTNTNFASVSNRSLSPGRSNSVDCFTHGILSSGNSNGSNSSGGSSGKRANRTRFTDYQIKVLQEFFENNAYPKDDDLEYLSKLLSLSPRVIVVWFQNARQKARKVYENQPPVEPAPGIDENTGRFQRTPGLNYQCKKCLLVFQRYYELIRHQKTHCFKEEDAKRSAQAQAAAAQMAAVLSSEDSNSSTIIEQNQQCSVTNSNPSTPAAPVTPTPSSAYPLSPASHNPSTPEPKESTLQCEHCNLVFPRFELWREHQLIHIMNPNLFPNYPPESPFGILQQQAQQQQQQQQSQQLQTPQQQQQPPQSHDQFANTNVAEMQTNNSNPPSPHPLLAMFNTNKRKYEEYVYLSDRDSDQPKDKRLRTTILPEQLDYLYQKYQIESNPSRKMLENIANEVGLKKRVVQVWFQNTRARERKGQFRAHSQVINKRCPFCPALFKVKTALESHLTTKHTDQCSRGEINIDALPDEEVSHDSTSFLSNQNTDTKFANFGANSMVHPLFQSMHGENDANLRKCYEDALRKYLTEIQSQQQHNILNGSIDKENFPADTSTKIKHESNEEDAPETTGESPLDLSKPVDLSNPIKFLVRPDDRSIISNGPLTDMNDRSMCEDEYTDSECSENMDDESPPASPASSRRIWSAENASHRVEEEWSSDDERAMKEKILKAQQSTLQSIMEAIGDSSSTIDSSIIVNKNELNGQIPMACAHKEADIGFICKRCKLVFPSENAVRSHQCKSGCGGLLRIRQYVYACKICNDDYQYNSINDMQRHFEMKHPRCASPLADEMENVVNQITALAAAKAAAQGNEDSNGNLFCQPGEVAKKSKFYANPTDQDPNGNLFCQPADVGKKSKLFAVPNSIATPTGGH